PASYPLLNIPESGNELRLDPGNYSESWPTLVIKPSGKMQGKSVHMLKADSVEKAMAMLQMTRKDQVPPVLASRGFDRLLDPLFGQRNTVLYQDFVAPAVKDGRAGRIRLNVFANPLESFSLSDYYMWTIFHKPENCPDGLLQDPRPYIVNWAYSQKKAQFTELSGEERELTDPAIPQVCRLIQAGLKNKFIYE
ncbi:MAG: hypothetical protein JXI33_04645, partial [Candidatus Aminicenantes bacterium]|nr:hypothetical protein [Candidatus Aminicenantes bacterium]